MEELSKFPDKVSLGERAKSKTLGLRPLPSVNAIVGRYIGCAAAVIAPGPSLHNVSPEWVRSLPVNFAVNAGYRFLDSDSLYSVSIDNRFWQGRNELQQIFPEERRFFLGLECLVSKREMKELIGYSLKDTGGKIIADGSSAHAAIHLALLAGCWPIYLLGIDQCLGPKGEVYAFPEEILKDTPRGHAAMFNNMQEGFATLARLSEPGRIWDCSVWGQLKCFPKRRLG